MATGSSLAFRSVVALALTLVFYVAALGAVVFLVHLAILAGGVKSASAAAPLLPLALAGILLWSVVPRRRRFVVPGPRLDRAAAPGLHALVDDVAARVGAPVPQDVYLIGEANAFVTKAGGFLGFGGRRVLAVGLPLLAALDAEALRAVIVHEFGHFHGGDVRLGPLVHGTRESIVRTVSTLGRVDADWRLSLAAALTRIPFLLYAKLYLRITLAVSRGQEFAADALGARLAGTAAMARGLRALPIVDPAWFDFLNAEVAGVLDAGKRPPVAAGFRRFLASPGVHAAVGERKPRRPANPYDSHPPIDARIRALGERPGLADDVPARESSLGLLADVDAAEVSLLAALTGSNEVHAFPRVAWSAVVSEVVLPRWRAVLARFGPALAGWPVEELPSSVPALEAAGREIARVAHVPARDAVPIAVTTLSAALGLLLMRREGRIASPPGEPTTVTVEGDSVDVVDVVRGLADGRIAPEAWAARCRALGVAGASLGCVVASAPGPGEPR